jgi:DNA ligase 1
MRRHMEGCSQRYIILGIPLHPTLGSPTRSLDEIYERLGDLPFTAEFKYDGQRAQIHGFRTTDGNISVRVFSRHLEDMTSKVKVAQDLLLNQILKFYSTPM